MKMKAVAFFTLEKKQHQMIYVALHTGKKGTLSGGHYLNPSRQCHGRAQHSYSQEGQNEASLGVVPVTAAQVVTPVLGLAVFAPQHQKVSMATSSSDGFDSKT